MLLIISIAIINSKCFKKMLHLGERDFGERDFKSCCGFGEFSIAAPHITVMAYLLATDDVYWSLEHRNFLCF